MKRFLCLLLAVLMLCSLAACGDRSRDNEDEERTERHMRHSARDDRPNDEASSPAEDNSPFTKETAPAETPAPLARRSVDLSEIPEDLMIFLSRFAWYGSSDIVSFTDDPACAINLMRSGFELIVNFDGYPGPTEEYLHDGDPLGRWQGCYRYDAEKTDRILKTVYHFSDSTIRALREHGEDANANYYYSDGSYYLPPLGVGGGFICYPCYAESDGTTLYLYYAAYAGDVMFYPAGIQYAEVSKEKLDGMETWTLKYWSRKLPLIGSAPDDAAADAALGDWELEADSLSSMRISDYADGRFHFIVGFYRLVGFEADAQLITHDGIALFSASDFSGFQGWVELADDTVTLHIYDSPDEYGNASFDGFFDGKAFRFVRPDPNQASIENDDFSITEDELLEEIDRIRDIYYTPTAADSKVVLSNGTDGWNYSREYYYHDGKLVFAFMFNGGEEHRLYFKDDHMIRYIDENHTVYDYGALDPFASWAERALEEGKQVFSSSAVDPEDWLGTWSSDSGEWIQVTDADENGISFIFHHATELSFVDTEYTLPFLDSSRSSVAEDESLIANGGWRYAFYLESDCILVTSRYPDKYFYK